jgi:multiple sugar transport system substrate-binding protein
MKQRKLSGFVFPLALCLVSVLAVGGCQAEKKSQSGGYDLTVWVFQDWTVGRAGEIFQEWAEEYKALNPKVRSITYVGKPDTDIVSSFIAGGALPDIFTIQFLNGKRIVENANILNLQPFYDTASESWKQAQNPNAMNDLLNNPSGTCWGVPLTANCQLLYRNLTVLEAAGVDTSKRPATMDELLDQFQKVKDAGYDVIPDLTASDWVTSAFVSGNPDLKIGWENGKTTITPEALIPGYEILRKVGRYSAPYLFLDQAATDKFIGNDLAFTIHGPFLNPNLAAAAESNSAFRYDAIPCPSQVSGGPYSASFGNEWAGAVDSGNSDKNEVMAGFLLYISDTSQMATFCRDMGRPVMNMSAMAQVVNAPDAPWLLGVCNEIISNCVNQAVPFKCDMMWETGCADSMFGLWDGSITDVVAAARDSVNAINENQ